MTYLLQVLLLIFMMIFNNATNTNIIIDVKITENNHSFQLIIDNYTKTVTSIGHNVDLYFHIPEYSRILSMHYPTIQPHDSSPLLDKLQITFLSSHVLVIPTTTVTTTAVNTNQSQHNYYLNALFKEKGSYEMFIRLECGSIDFMTIPHIVKNNITYLLESRTYVNNNSFTIDIDTSVNEDYDYDLSKIETEERSRYCSATEAFHGRFYINNNNNYIDFLDKHIHNGDIYSIFKPYNYQLRRDDIQNSSILLNLFY